MKRFNLSLLVLVFSLLLGGCSSSGNSGDSSNSGRTIKVILPETYLDANNQSLVLPSGKSGVIITAGFDQSEKLKFQQFTFAKTGSPITISIPDLKGATSLSFVTEISIDSSFYDEATWSHTSDKNMIITPALRTLSDGTNTCYFDSNITSVTFSDLKVLRNTTTATVKSLRNNQYDIKHMIQLYCNELHITLAQPL